MILSWWLWVTLAGVAVMPLNMRLFAALPDKGYLFSRTFGLLIIGFVFWWLAVTGFVMNTVGSIVLSWLLVGIATLIFYYRDENRVRWTDWWQDNRRVIIIGEILFAVLFVSWAWVRASHPSLTGTEKPMEIAFMSAILRADTFPPHDPWMSGYAISYYHFGYIITASLAKLSHISSTVAFNLMIALLFALTGLNTFGVVYNLVQAHRSTKHQQPIAIGVGVLGLVMVVLMGNFQLPLIELPYQSGNQNTAYYEFWDAQDRYTAPPARNFDEQDTFNLAGFTVVNPSRWDFWWWFRASRVINDRHFPTVQDGNVIERPVGANVIDEFPQFSFLLADVHPHVLALPFSVLMLGLALNLVLRQKRLPFWGVLIYGVAVGGLMFLNMWDGPIYMVVLVGAEGARRLLKNGNMRLTVPDWSTLGLFFLTLVGLAFMFYLPFFASFRSQASGFIPNLEFPTLFRQYFLMFGPFILLLTPYLFFEMWRGREQLNLTLGAMVAAGLFTLLSLPIILIGVLVASGIIPPTAQPALAQYLNANGGIGNVLAVFLSKRLSHSLTTIVLLAVIGLIIARLFGTKADSKTPAYDRTVAFTLFILASGAGLTLVPEFIYLRDNFGVRINTIFKFYYQAWVMFAVAASYATYTLIMVSHDNLKQKLQLRELAIENTPQEPDINTMASPAWLRAGYSVVLTVTLILGLMYPILGIHNRTRIESGRWSYSNEPLTLDGGTSLASENDYLALMCFNDLIDGNDVVVAEAIGPAYRHQYGRVGVLTGVPIVLGWEGHENQWRGATYPMIAGTRRIDIETLYNTPFWDEAIPIIERYDIDYIFYGTTERYGTGEQTAYAAVGEEKFIENLEPVCQFGDSLFYRVIPRSLNLVE